MPVSQWTTKSLQNDFQSRDSGPGLGCRMFKGQEVSVFVIVWPPWQTWHSSYHVYHTIIHLIWRHQHMKSTRDLLSVVIRIKLKNIIIDTNTIHLQIIFLNMFQMSWTLEERWYYWVKARLSHHRIWNYGGTLLGPGPDCSHGPHRSNTITDWLWPGRFAKTTQNWQ